MRTVCTASAYFFCFVSLENSPNKSAHQVSGLDAGGHVQRPLRHQQHGLRRRSLHWCVFVCVSRSVCARLCVCMCECPFTSLLSVRPLCHLSLSASLSLSPSLSLSLSSSYFLFLFLSISSPCSSFLFSLSVSLSDRLAFSPLF